MKKYFITMILCIGFAAVNNNSKAQELEMMIEQKEVLKLNTDLIEMKIELQKEKLNNSKITAAVEKLNRKSDKKTDDFSFSAPLQTAEDAKRTAKLLKKTESANRDLYKSNTKIISIEADIKKLELKLDRLQYNVNMVKK